MVRNYINHNTTKSSRSTRTTQESFYAKIKVSVYHIPPHLAVVLLIFIIRYQETQDIGEQFVKEEMDRERYVRQPVKIFNKGWFHTIIKCP